MQAFVIDGYGHVFRLRQHLYRLLRITQRFIGESSALQIDLYAAFQDDGPKDRHAVTLGQPAVPLVGPNVRDSCAQFPPPLSIASPWLPGWPKNSAWSISGRYSATMS